MNIQQPTPKEQAQAELGMIKQALDAAVKGSVFQNMDTAFAVSQSFNNIATIVQKYFEEKNGTETKI